MLAAFVLLPAAAAGARVRVHADIPAVAATGDVVRVRGSVSHRARVVLQRRTTAGWRRVGRARRAARRFTLSWRAPVRPGVVALRVAAGHAFSPEGRMTVVPLEVVAPGAIRSAPEPGAAGQLRISGRRRVRKGDFIAAGAGRATPFGLLGRVVSARRARGSTTVKIEPASLVEALPAGEIEVRSAGAARAAALSPHPFGSPLPCGAGAAGSLTGSLAAALAPDFQLSWSGGTVRSARAAITLRGDADLGVRVGAKVVCNLAETPVATWLAPPLTAFAGPIPVVIVPRTTLYVSADARSAATLETRISGPITASAGLTYDGTAHATGSFDQRLTATGPSTRADASVAARLTPSVEFLLYGQVGPRFDLTTGLQLDATSSGDPWWTLAAPVELSAGLRVPGLDLAQRPVFSRTFPLAQASPLPSSPAVPPQSHERARINWDTTADIDLHVWDSSGHHTWYRESGIPGVLLSPDDTDGFGPERFEESGQSGRTFTFGLCYFDGAGATRVTAILTDPDGRQRSPAATLRTPGDAVLIGSSPVGAAFTPPAGWCQRRG